MKKPMIPPQGRNLAAPAETAVGRQPAGLVAGNMQANREPLSPEQKKNLAMFLTNGMRLIHSEATRDLVLRRLQVGKPAEAVAEQTLSVVLQLERDAEKKGLRLDDDLKGLVATELMGQIIEVGEAAGLFKMDEKQIRAAAGQAVGKYFQVQMDSGKMSMEQMQALADRFQREAEAEGAGSAGGPRPGVNQQEQGGAANV